MFKTPEYNTNFVLCYHLGNSDFDNYNICKSQNRPRPVFQPENIFSFQTIV